MRSIPIFPLGIVLNPGGYTHLRVFEPRYLDMVRECTRAQKGFGICAVLAAPGSDQRGICTIGTEAKIVDFDLLPDGLLGIEVMGMQRFRIVNLHGRDNGLNIADVEDIPAEPIIPVPAEFGLLSDIVAGVLNDHRSQAKQDIDRNKRQALGRDQLDNSSWVGFRLSEVLPIELRERQQLIELSDPIERLRVLLDWLPRFQKEDDEENS
jgi:uncharacterized protein